MSIRLYHACYNEKFFCLKEQVPMFDSIRENNSSLYSRILEAVAVKQNTGHDRDVMVTIFFANGNSCPKTCTEKEFKLIKEFEAPHTATCPSIHSGEWITENVFVTGRAQ